MMVGKVTILRCGITIAMIFSLVLITLLRIRRICPGIGANSSRSLLLLLLLTLSFPFVSHLKELKFRCGSGRFIGKDVVVVFFDSTRIAATAIRLSPSLKPCTKNGGKSIRHTRNAQRALKLLWR